MLNIKIEKTTAPKQKPDENNLGFGKIFTDHMFIMNYTEGQGWHDARIVPYGNLTLSPACMVFHYGQEMFEGLKAYRADDGRVLLFRQSGHRRVHLWGQSRGNTPLRVFYQKNHQKLFAAL